MKIRTAYPLIINGKVVANGNYEGGFANAYGKRRITARTRPKPRPAINPDESPSDVQARNLIDGASYFDGDTMNSYADGTAGKNGVRNFVYDKRFDAFHLLIAGVVGMFIGGFYIFNKENK